MSNRRAIAVVTGGGTGIGRATAERLARAGLDVLITGRRTEILETAASEIQTATDRCVEILTSDLSRADEAERIALEAGERFGGVDVFVANAAAYDLISFIDMNPDAWDGTVNVALRGAALSSAAAARVMRERGGGRIVLISSTNAVASDHGTSAYDASKGALNSLARAMAVDLSQYRITVNAVAPGWVRTPETQSFVDAAGGDKIFRRVNPVERFGEPSEIAEVIAFLATDAPAFLTGSVITVDGGQTALAPQVEF